MGKILSGIISARKAGPLEEMRWEDDGKPLRMGFIRAVRVIPAATPPTTTPIGSVTSRRIGPNELNAFGGPTGLAPYEPKHGSVMEQGLRGPER